MALGRGSNVGWTEVRRIADRLFRLSESRGKDASGAALAADHELLLIKTAASARTLIRSAQYNGLFDRASGAEGSTARSLAMIGHCRMVTNGSQTFHDNNQPLYKDGLTAVHNGIVVNDAQLWADNPDLERCWEVDTEAALALLSRALKNAGRWPRALGETYGQIYGMASLAIIPDDQDCLVLATNNGSLYYLWDQARQAVLFASERYFLNQLLAGSEVRSGLDPVEIRHLLPNQALVLEFDRLEATPFNMGDADALSSGNKRPTRAPSALVDLSVDSGPAESPFPRPTTIKPTGLPDLPPPSDLGLRRCTRCILPETMPFIEFDDQGVCNYCRQAKPTTYLGAEALARQVAPYRTGGGDPDCIVAFSGGRDSSYGLHYIVRELGLNPLAFSYDWGMITDLGRRNQSRLCGKLGVEHILISADLTRKLTNIRQNVNAWLKKPDLGLIPLFMAGDKQFYYYAHKLRKINNIRLFIFCAGNDYERTDFKIGFCGIPPAKDWGKGILTGMPGLTKARLAAYYGHQYLTNPAFLNASLLDTLWAFYSSYLLKDDYLYLYHYLPWDEEEINATLIDEYDWELAEDTETTWRIGDGTAPFYNYIYYTVAGLTEFDTFRSHQVRDGVITREQALELIEHENAPRWQSIQWYADRVGFDLDRAVEIIERIPKLYRG